MDGIDAYIEIKRECIEAALKANPYLHCLIPLFELMFKHGSEETWFYDEHENSVIPEALMVRCRAEVCAGNFFFAS